jgi:hypothetical protein
MPTSFDPLGDNEHKRRGSANYQATRLLALHMGVGTVQIMKERGIDGRASIAQKMDNEIWRDWKASSTSSNGQLMQLAIAEELDGRVNEQQLEDGVEYIRRNPADRWGSYEMVKAYVRGKWVTQWLLDKANVSTVDVYRGINLAHSEERFEQVEGPSGSFTRLPDAPIRRNGAASWTTTQSIANNWRRGSDGVVLRATVPRTAVVSVAVYGQNVHNERESVIAGWRGAVGMPGRVQRLISLTWPSDIRTRRRHDPAHRPFEDGHGRGQATDDARSARMTMPRGSLRSG